MDAHKANSPAHAKVRMRRLWDPAQELNNVEANTRWSYHKPFHNLRRACSIEYQRPRSHSFFSLLEKTHGPSCIFHGDKRTGAPTASKTLERFSNSSRTFAVHFIVFLLLFNVKLAASLCKRWKFDCTFMERNRLGNVFYLRKIAGLSYCIRYIYKGAQSVAI